MRPQFVDELISEQCRAKPYTELVDLTGELSEKEIASEKLNRSADRALGHNGPTGSLQELRKAALGDRKSVV